MDKPVEPKTEEQLLDDKYPAKDFFKKVFSLSKEELVDLQPFEDATRFVQTQLVLGQIAQKAKDNYVANNVLKRLAIKPSQDSNFTYDLGKGQVIVYEPRLWCSKCNARKAEYKFKEKIYCVDCIEILKKEQAEKEVKPVGGKAEKK